MYRKDPKDWIKEEKLNLVEKIRFYCDWTGSSPKPNRCNYDGTRFELYKKYRKRDVPQGAKDLGLIEWYILGKCPNCNIESLITGSPNSYLW